MRHRPSVARRHTPAGGKSGTILSGKRQTRRRLRNSCASQTYISVQLRYCLCAYRSSIFQGCILSYRPWPVPNALRLMSRGEYVGQTSLLALSSPLVLPPLLYGPSCRSASLKALLLTLSSLRCRYPTPLLTNYCFGLAPRHLRTRIATQLAALPRSLRNAFLKPRLGPARQFCQISFLGSDALLAPLRCSAGAFPFLCLLGKLLRSHIDWLYAPQP